MKKGLLVISILFSCKAFAQSADEMKILNLSKQMFEWEIQKNTDSLAILFDDKLTVVNSRGEMQNKHDYLNTFFNNNMKHDSIDVEQSTAIAKNNVVTVIGKGRFVITLNGNKLHRHLSYMEIFIKDEEKWKLLALYASALPE